MRIWPTESFAVIFSFFPANKLQFVWVVCRDTLIAWILDSYSRIYHDWCNPVTIISFFLDSHVAQFYVTRQEDKSRNLYLETFFCQTTSNKWLHQQYWLKKFRLCWKLWRKQEKSVNILVRLVKIHTHCCNHQFQLTVATRIGTWNSASNWETKESLSRDRAYWPICIEGGGIQALGIQWS